MSANFQLKLALVVLVANGLVAGPADALSTDSDGCMTLAEFNEQLPAEGQGSVIVAESVIPAKPSSPARSSLQVFTALKNGKVGKGYSFVADTPMGVRATKLCIAGEYNYARGLDVESASIPVGVAANSNLAKVIEFFIRDKGFNPMFIGERNGAIVVVVGDPSKKDQANLVNGFILVGNNDPTVKAGDLGALRHLNYSPNYDLAATRAKR
jgi:hypothetical protein